MTLPSPGPTHPTYGGPANESVVEDVTCLGCGCLCDDIALTVAGGRITGARNACELGRRWFFADRAKDVVNAAMIDGRVTDWDEALDRAAEILGRAKAPVVLGLTRTSTETVGVAVAIADRIGAVMGLGRAGETAHRTLAVQRVGKVSASLGEVKNRADVVVFWGVDPVVTHPRHLERYSVEPPGRFVPRGRAGRTVMVADGERTATAERADLFLNVSPEGEYATLWTLRALVRGVMLDPEAVERTTGHPLTLLGDWAERWKNARYGAWFSGARPGRTSAEYEAELMLVRDLNASTRFVILSTGSPGNAAGAEAVLTWQSGCASSVDYTRGYPRYAPGASSAAEMLARGEADAALIVADRVEDDLPGDAGAHLAGIPRIAIAPEATTTWRTAGVALACATTGIDAPGTVTRTDGVTLPLRPGLAASLPTDGELLRAILDRLKGAGGRPFLTAEGEGA